MTEEQVVRTVSTIPLPRLTGAQDALLRAAFVELMATSAGVAVDRLAELGGITATAAEAELGRLVSAGRVARDQDGRVTGALGLTVERTRHELTIGTEQWHTWCVIDALGILGALAASGKVRSTVPATEQPVEVEFTDGVPAGGTSDVVVFVPDYVTGSRVIESWCPAVNFFPDVSAAEDWAADASVRGQAVSLKVATAAATERWRARLGG